MFVLTTIVDTVRIPPPLLAQPTLVSVHSEMDKKYPNRVIMDVGLAICRYGDALQVGDGVCVAGDGGAHHEVIARLIVFRPFVEEVCIGTILKSTEEGIQVSIGFFDDIFIPAYWMLRPSHYEKSVGLWVWTPTYDEEGGDEAVVKTEEGDIGDEAEDVGGEAEDQAKEEEQGSQEDENRFEMEIGAEIRFKVKSINFTQVINTAKGVQANTTSTSQSHPGMERALSVGSASELTNAPERPVRKRSSSMDLSESKQMPASMHIVASICEDGLGLTSWWTTTEENEDEEPADEFVDEEEQ